MSFKTVFACLLAVVLLFPLACERQGPAERAGEKVDKAAERTGEQLEEAGEKVERKIDK